MNRKIILAVLFTASIVTNFSFSPGSSAKATSTTSSIDKKYIIVCLNAGGCRLCGGVNVTPVSTTVCASASCFGIGASICVTFSTTFNRSTGKEVVDEASISIDYSSPELKGQVNEASLKADFIQQVNSQL